MSVDRAWRRVARAALERGIRSAGPSYPAGHRPSEAMVNADAEHPAAQGTITIDHEQDGTGGPGTRPADRDSDALDSGRHQLTTEGTGPPRGEGTRFRTDVQALRAVAVLAVLLNHLWPGRLAGGYVGVDVFFVISGFLISSHLCRELDGTGRVRLGRFYARRIRRLLPAAFLVLVLTMVGAYFLMPYPRWAETARHAVASALYGENWLLTVESVNYSAADAAPSLVQHYWSLSVEEQFYLVWPLLLFLLFKVRLRRARFAGVAVVAAASLAFCVYYTAHAPSQAYFVTPTRVWEFAVGALVALAGARLALPAGVAGVASFAGLAMIIGPAVAYGPTTAFPGYLALVPTVGTALVIIAGNRGAKQWHTPLSAARPVQWLGNISYSLYLWHWPLILLAPFAIGQVLTARDKLVILAVSLLLAAASKVLVEDRGLAWRPRRRPTGLTFAAMAAGMAVLALVAGALNWSYERQVVQAGQQIASAAPSSCHGADAMVSRNDCHNRFGPAQVVAMGPANAYFQVPRECRQIDDNMAGATKTTLVCDFSQHDPTPEVVWLLGDSHALHWQGAVMALARERKWLVKFGGLGGCPFAKVDFTGYRGPADDGFKRTCKEWTERMADVVAADRPSTVFLSFFARMEPADDGTGRSQTAQYRDGLEPYWRAWADAGAHVVVLADPPLNGDVRPADCVTLNPDDPLACAVDRNVAQPRDPLAEAARSSREPAVSLVDLTDYFCDRRKCYAVIGNVAVYYDANHLNLEFTRDLAPMLAAALDRATGHQ
ncbi:acyltransferase family protein [Actinophytocola sp.]|uniref:acyltransferase family protein n=1 Tax=Actinophytocola sp. TaxID=1872138 RepID=UPI002D3BDF63|nr:acyltransferase family protein [Actinophytocola sp.]HYQ61744.1 acyltransferase family protein [Actinophytocola sp.]